MTDHPELDEYEPHGEKPMRAPWTRRLIQLAAIIGILLLVMPLVASQARVANISAQDWCKRWVAFQLSEPGTPSARFELLGPGLLGWECYATGVVGGDVYLGNLGIIPGPPRVLLGGTPGSDV